MANPSSPGVLAALEEIMRIYRALPLRPSIEEVEAAVVVIQSVDAEEEARMREIGRIQKPPDVPEQLFLVLQEARKNQVLFQCREQRRDAMAVVDLDRRFQVFDELVQRASKAMSLEDGDGRGDEEVGFEAGFDVLVPRLGRSLSLIGKEKDDKLGDFNFSNGPAYSFKSEVSSATGDRSKLSLIQLASLIESSAKNGVGVINLKGKLLDQIEWLPVSLGKLQEVSELNLSENRIITLPPSISSLKSLTKLDMHSNQLSSLPDSFAELSNLVDLDLHANRLKSLPSLIGNLTNLANLNLSSNQLSSLPDTLGNLTNLQRLNTETNNLEELPYSIGSCTALVELRVDFNQLKALPEAVGKLVNLEVLALHYNRVKSLPTTMASLTKLKELDVSFNELESIPESLSFATSLVKLDVGRNFADLRVLPRSIGNLEMLEELDISSNQIRVLPDSFRFLSKLRVINADETPLEVPPRNIVKLGAQAVVQYMADLVEGNVQQADPIRQRHALCFHVCSLS
ncbi:plant intracellular Ras-group-related LRR protein 5-like [Zingiber officinale]|uniref:plant intracellular Ras-group-related LRR protein 5-like n=1 Tax=Zingiber officinale TaxID=94328 RepID=UPI001C4D6A3E|nr:plant intracellular Ras-group-related LRR protein 5-like [Zingiber officinale]